jgi:putative SOS response-associated peptidase YedK
MCGRYVSPDEADLERYWHIGRQNNNPFTRHYNVAPTVQVPIIYPGDDGLDVSLARWGLVPFWWKQPKLPPFTFNARIEEAASKPMWRGAVKRSRCLIPAIGWYEWKPVEVVDAVTGEIKTAKQPYFLHLAGKPAFAFAGVMSWHKAATGEFSILTAAIITRAAEGSAADVHTRMPLILPTDAESAWLDREQQDGAKALEAANDAAIKDVQFYAVSSRVNSSKNAGAELIEPFPNPA